MFDKIVQQTEQWSNKVLGPLGRVVISFIAFVLAILPIVGVLFFGLGVYRIFRPVAGDSTIGALIFGVILFMAGLVSYRSGTFRDVATLAKLFPEVVMQQGKPIVHFWMHNDIIGVAADLDYQLYYQR